MRMEATISDGDQYCADQFDNSISTLKQTSFAGIISQCGQMKRVFSLLEKVAQTNTTVLVLGASGTGKELVAKAIHKLSGRSGSLVPVNCGAIPEEILESELFGHEKGAFTGATSYKVGRFQVADRGTIFLDEIGEMSPRLQVKLLRILQDKKVEPVGSTKSIEVDVRIIAATNKDLREEVKAGRFREDLYYRLQVVPVELPPLKQRRGDIELLSNYFLNTSCNELGRERLEFSEKAFQALLDYSWPGNIRELENVIQRLAILSEGTQVEENDLPDYIRTSTPCSFGMDQLENIPEDGLDFNQIVNDLESQLISSALNQTNWNKKAAAKLLNLNRTTLVEKIKKKGLQRQVEVIIEESPRPYL